MEPLSPARTLTPDPSPGGRGEFGYNLVVLIVAIAVLNIAIAAMLPLWSTAIKREKEEELIFRGFQYAEAIRVFHTRYQRYPNKIEELLEIKPRCIRQLWKDPMTDDGKWVLIPQNDLTPVTPQTQPPSGRRGGRGGKIPREEGNENGENPPTGESPDPNGRPQFGPAKGETVQVGPFIGVHSRSSEKSKLIFYGHERYDEWHFTENLLMGGGGIGGPGAPPSRVPGIRDPGAPQVLPNFSTRWLGRPMRFMNQVPAPQGGTMPDGSRPGGGRPGNKPGPRPKQPSTPQ